MKTNKSTLSPIKGMPNAPEAEQAVIGSLLSLVVTRYLMPYLPT